MTDQPPVSDRANGTLCNLSVRGCLSCNVVTHVQWPANSTAAGNAADQGCQTRRKRSLSRRALESDPCLHSFSRAIAVPPWNLQGKLDFLATSKERTIVKESLGLACKKQS